MGWNLAECHHFPFILVSSKFSNNTYYSWLSGSCITIGSYPDPQPANWNKASSPIAFLTLRFFVVSSFLNHMT